MNKRPGIKFEIHEGNIPQPDGTIKVYYWLSMKANNGKKLMTSQMYKHHKSAKNALKLIEVYVKNY